MGSLIIILSVFLLGVVLVQIGKVNELSSAIRGEQESEYSANTTHAVFGLLFMVGFLVLVFGSFFYYKNSMLGYGPLTSASKHGWDIDYIFNVTMVITVIVFVITHIALFVYAFQYRNRPGHVAKFIPHDNRLEIILMVIPSIVMAILVVGGLNVWNNTMIDIAADAVPGKDFIEIEGNGQQFGWNLRYPGPDNRLGGTYFKKISSSNPLGQVWEDPKNHDDFQPSNIVLPKGMQVRVRITSRDVLHNFYLPHHKVKMDAVPGMPTHFVFTPTITTAEYREQLGELDSKGNPLYPEWHTPADPSDPENKLKRYEVFGFELACAELCGNGHFSMRKEVTIVTPEEYEKWLGEQTSYYEANIKGKEEDVKIGKTEVEAESENKLSLENAKDQSISNIN